MSQIADSLLNFMACQPYKTGDLFNCGFPSNNIEPPVPPEPYPVNTILTLIDGTKVEIEGEVLSRAMISDVYKNTLNGCVIGSGVTSIGQIAFYSCTGLTSVTIPNSVTSIGGSAFRDCSSLESIEIPNSVTSIGNWAFNSCTSLTSVTIPNSVTSIGSSAFSGCSVLTSVIVDSDDIVNKTYTTNNNFQTFFGKQVRQYIIGDSVTAVGDYTFYNCSNIIFVKIGNNVTSIGYEAFYNCYNLTSITIPNSIENIGSNAFKQCKNLSSVILDSDSIVGKDYSTIDTDENYGGALWGFEHQDTNNGVSTCIIGEHVTQIGENSFYGCTSLKNIVIGDNVESIRQQAFVNCANLSSINISDKVSSVGENAFTGCGILSSNVQINIGSGVSNINSNSFATSARVTITIDSNNLKYDARNGCNAIIETYTNKLITGYSNTTIPNTVINIGTGAYLSVSSSITIPNTILYIDADAFNSSSDGKIIIEELKNTYTNVIGAKNIQFNSVAQNTFDGDYNSSILLVHGTSKSKKTYNIYTDNQIVHDQMAAFVDTNTIVNLYHLDNTPWE